MTDFFRFPHTPHLAWLGENPLRNDKLLSPSEAKSLLHSKVLVEEKLDGANIGFSTDPSGHISVQNRGQYLSEPFSGQFQKLSAWLAPKAENIAAMAADHLILFGEWCAARHSVGYDALQDWFLLFDVYDRKAGKFWSSRRRNNLADLLDIYVVPELYKGKITLAELFDNFLKKSSAYSSTELLEGVVIRRESEDWLLSRAKLVRSDFSQNINQHWSRRKIEWNQLAGQEVITHSRLEKSRDQVEVLRQNAVEQGIKDLMKTPDAPTGPGSGTRA